MTVQWTWRKSLVVASLLLIVAALIFLDVSNSHWMRRVDFGTVKIDERQVHADIYFANPKGEAEAVVLVHLNDGSDYFLDFGSEKVRRASRSEYVRLLGGAWSYRALPNGTFYESLPFVKLNEFRIAAPNGQIISVQF